MEKLNKKIIGVVIVLAILIISIIVYAYICTDAFKSNEKLFGKYLLDNINQLENFNLKPYNEVLDKIESQNSETEVTINYTYTPEETEEPLLQNTNTNVTATLNIKSDVKNNKQSMTLKTNSNQKELILLSTLSDENTVGVKVEELYDKYLALENRELKTFFSKMGFSEEELETIPNKIEAPNTEEFTPEELEILENLKNKYIKKISDPIDKTCYSKEKSVQVESNGENVVADKYVLTINEKQFATIVTTTIKEFLADQEFLRLYEGRISEEQIKSLQKENDEYIKNLENIDENSKVNIIVYVKDKKTIRTDYISEKQEVSFEVINNFQDSFIKFTVKKDKKDDSDVGTETIIKVKNTSTEKSGKLECEISLVYNKDDISSLNSEISNSYGYENYYEKTYKDQNLEFVLTAENVNDDKISINLNSGNIKIDGNINLNKDIKVEDFTDENAVILNDYSSLQLEKLGEELMENAVLSITRNLNSSINPVVTIFAGMYMASSSNEDSALTNTTNTVSNTTNNTVDNNTVTENIITRNMIDYMFTNTTNTTNSTTNNTSNNNTPENTSTNRTSTNTAENTTNTSQDTNTVNNTTNSV